MREDPPVVAAQDPLGGAASFREERVEVADGVVTRLLRWRTPAPSRPPVVFVPGWVSDPAGWFDLLRAMTADREVVYVETREKASAYLPKRLGPDDFTVPRLADDLRRVCAGLELRETPVVMGSSLGGTVILEALKGEGLPARAAFLIGPNGRFRIPWWGWPLLRLPDGAYTVASEFALWYLRRFRVNAEREPEQMERYVRTVRSAEPGRLKLSARALGHYTVWPGLAGVKVPVAVAYAPSDTLHVADDILHMVRELPVGVAVECPSNLHMHRPEILVDLDRFVAGVDGNRDRT